MPTSRGKSVMRISSLTTALALALAASACDRDGVGNDLSTDANLAEDSAADVVLGGEPAANAAASLPMTAAGFANAVAATDLFEIESAGIAAGKGGSADVKAFARQLLADHRKSSADLKAAAAKASPPLTVTAALDAEQQAMLDQLRSANGADFDRRFIDQQTNVHQKALVLLQDYIGRGEAQPFKDFASNSRMAVQRHFEHLNSIRK